MLAVLDALGGGPRTPEEVLAAVASRAHSHTLNADSRNFLRRGSQFQVLPDGRWAVPEDAGELLAKVRAAVRESVGIMRRYRGPWATPEARTAARQAEEARRKAHGDELANQPRTESVPSRAHLEAALRVGPEVVRREAPVHAALRRVSCSGLDA